MCGGEETGKKEKPSDKKDVRIRREREERERRRGEGEWYEWYEEGMEEGDWFGLEGRQGKREVWALEGGRREGVL